MDAGTQEPPVTGPRPGAVEAPRSVRVAGAVLLVVGAANVAFGALSLATDLVLVAPGNAGLLVVLGVVTGALGVLVRRGLRWATMVALVVFGGLFLVQAARAAVAGDAGPDAVPATVTLAGLVIPLVLAQRALRRDDSGDVRRD